MPSFLFAGSRAADSLHRQELLHRALFLAAFPPVYSTETTLMPLAPFSLAAHVSASADYMADGVRLQCCGLLCAQVARAPVPMPVTTLPETHAFARGRRAPEVTEFILQGICTYPDSNAGMLWLGMTCNEQYNQEVLCNS